MGSERDVRPRHPDWRRKAILGTTSLVGLLLAIAGMTPVATAVESLPGRLVLDLPAWLSLPFLVVMFLEAVFVFYLLIPALLLRSKNDERKSSTAMSLILLLLTAAALWTMPRNYLGIDFYDVANGLATTAGPAGSLASAGAEPPQPVHSALISGMLETFLLALALMAFGIVAWLYFGIRPLRGRRVSLGSAHSALQVAVEDSLDELRHLPDARLAIIRCYERFERVLAGADVRRSHWQTVMEFMRTALKHPWLPREDVRELTSLFEVARFSRHELGPGHRERAWQALVAIKAALEKEDVHASAT